MLSMDDIESALLGDAVGAQQAQKENSVGSYERFMGSMAGSNGKRG